jgi:hypothetical protein
MSVHDKLIWVAIVAGGLTAVVILAILLIPPRGGSD